MLRHGKVELALPRLRAAGAVGARPLLILHGLGERSPEQVPRWADAWTGEVAALELVANARRAVLALDASTAAWRELARHTKAPTIYVHDDDKAALMNGAFLPSYRRLALSDPKDPTKAPVEGVTAYFLLTHQRDEVRGVPADHRTDIFSFGVVLYEMLAARVPFCTDTPVATMYKHVHEPPPPLLGRVERTRSGAGDGC